MLSNERFALACRAYYDKIGLVVDATNGEFAHSPLTRKECETGYYLLHRDHQHQGLLQSRDLGKCCFFTGDAKKWLKDNDDFSESFSELWDIYWEYSGSQGHLAKDKNGKSVHALRWNEKLHEAKNEEGKSLHWAKAVKKVHEEKNEEGKSLHALMMNKKLHEAKNEEGKSLHGLKIAEKIHKEKDELGRSKTAMKTNNQVWESTIDGFRSNAGAVAYHNKANGWDPKARIRIS